MIYKNVIFKDAIFALKVMRCGRRHFAEMVFSFYLKGRKEKARNLTTFANHDEKIVTNLFAQLKGFLQILKTFLILTTICSPIHRMKGQLTIGSWQEVERTSFILFKIIFAPLKVSLVRKTFVQYSRGQGFSLFYTRWYLTKLNPICLLYLKDVFFDQLKGILIASDYSDGCGPVFISLKNYPGPRLHGFLFFSLQRHQGHEKEKKKTNTLRSKSQTKGYKNRWVCRGEFFTPPHTWIWKHTQGKEVSCKKWESLKQTISRTSINC
jgi:hypothetical protein